MGARQPDMDVVSMIDGQHNNGFPDLLGPEKWEEVGSRYGLTNQEQRVLRLLCQGLGNGRIAASAPRHPDRFRTSSRSACAKNYQRGLPTHPERQPPCARTENRTRCHGSSRSRRAGTRRCPAAEPNGPRQENPMGNTQEPVFRNEPILRCGHHARNKPQLLAQVTVTDRSAAR